MNPSAPRIRRMLPAIVIVLIAVLGLLGYFHASGHLPGRQKSFPAVYDSNTAMTLAGVQVPAQVNSYYFFFLDTGADEKTDTADLADKLMKASQEKDYLGITGPDAARNLRILRNALKADAGKPLDQMTLVYVGPSTQRKAVNRLIADRKLTLRYVAYP